MIRRALTACILTHAAAAAQDSCDEALFVAHWTHVPKAGGTALAALAKRIACAKTPKIAHLNPCCIQDFCADLRTCEATATTCPLVLGIGRHETAMSRLIDIPCCAREWYLATVNAFMRYALKLSRLPGPHTEAQLRKVGIVPQGALSQPDVGFASSIKGRNHGMSWDRRALRGHCTWPLETRIRFFAETGVPRGLIKFHIDKVFKHDAVTRERYNQIAKAAEKDALGRIGRAGAMEECHRAAHGTWSQIASKCQPISDHKFARKTALLRQAAPRLGVHDHAAAALPAGGVGLFLPRCALSPLQRRGASMASWWREFRCFTGHNPNADFIYHLRPEFYGRRGPGKNKPYSFYEFVGYPEYANILTKLFGDFTCPKARTCLLHTASTEIRPKGKQFWMNPQLRGCGLLNVCHAYRNVTGLGEAHVTKAKAALDVHAFIGLTEAYDSSVKLALHTFGLEALPDGSDFAKIRVKRPKACGGAPSLTRDPRACRAAFAANAFDHAIYEHAHRIFCARLTDAGLRGDAAVERELTAASLCGSLDFADVEAVCGRLETPAALELRAANMARCSSKRPTIYAGGMNWIAPAREPAVIKRRSDAELDQLVTI